MSSNNPDPVRLARTYLDTMEARDLDTARSLLAPDFTAIFPGPRIFNKLEDLVASGAARYRFVRKTYARTYQTTEGRDGIDVVIFSGTLRGEWADGTAFDGIRFTDQFRIRDGVITEQQVWNDMGEALLARSTG
ncbi:nuclear transport factor 2 family protein [Hoeflea sp. YIM 152468]|uniref:nuclear transport factor 2 family protein n=1 Tax=Hoeflea sp. YIM 152468 TaxID=3031759 RepID=UPI0023D9C8F0|nr:nuclear transport factor 2 family protein [Hoeflea sp. YIM 152468]MDF1609070.1 nuclear transport factor 2 family protein [Hoeflea sp. YIM 152468]